MKRRQKPGPREKSHVDSLPKTVLEQVRRTVLAMNPEKRTEAVLAAVTALWKEGQPATFRRVRERTGLTISTSERVLRELVEAGRLRREGSRTHIVFLTPELYEAAMGEGAGEET